MQGTTYTVHEVAQLSGASIRALHHYESLGLLAPKRLANGYRAYDTHDLERLQQIMLFRACGMPLADIGRILNDPDYDARAVLAQHLDALEQRKQQLDTLVQTVKKTIASLEGATTMTDEERFEGLKQAAIAENERRYGAEARARHGNAAVDAANEKLANMTQQEWTDMNQLEQAIIEKLKQALAEGDSQSEAAREVATLHAQWIRMHWGEGAYSPAAHVQLARAYLADERFRTYYDSRAGGGATEALVAAIETWIA